MYSSSRSATTHIFFPPRLEIVAQQENANGFPSDTGNQFAFDGFFRYQADGPTGAAFRRIAAYHCNQTLFLAVVEHFRRSRSLFLVQRAPLASCNKAKARRTTRTCWTPPLNSSAISL